MSEILSASAKMHRNLFIMLSCFFANKVVERCLRDGTTKRGSSERQYFLNEGDSTIESGSMLTATRQITASKTRHCRESFGAYFLPGIKESTVVCSPVTFALVHRRRQGRARKGNAQLKILKQEVNH